MLIAIKINFTRLIDGHEVLGVVFLLFVERDEFNVRRRFGFVSKRWFESI